MPRDVYQQSPDSERAAVEGQINYLNQRLDEHEKILERMPEMMKSAMTSSMREVLADTELRAAFWKAGYAELTDHAQAGASQWLGKRLLVAAATAIFVLSLSYLVRNGWIK